MLLINSNHRFGAVISSFGERDNPFNPGEKENHSGVDISAEEGTAIGAGARGTVVYSYDNGSKDLGNTVIVEYTGADGNEMYVLYAHLNGNDMPDVGQELKQGNKIGEVGHSGRTQGRHLHLEVLVPSSFVWEEVKTGEVRKIPVFSDGKSEWRINSSYYNTKRYPFYEDKNANRVHIGIPGDVGREDPTTYDKWPKSGDSGSMSEEEEVQKELAPYKKIPGYVPLLTEEEIRKKVKERRRKRSSSSSSSGETLERRGEKVWRIEDDGSARGYVKAWS